MLLLPKKQVGVKMAMRCEECGGIIPDVMIGNKDRNDCKNHIKTEVDVNIGGRKK